MPELLYWEVIHTQHLAGHITTMCIQVKGLQRLNVFRVAYIFPRSGSGEYSSAELIPLCTRQAFRIN